MSGYGARVGLGLESNCSRWVATRTKYQVLQAHAGVRRHTTCLPDLLAAGFITHTPFHIHFHAHFHFHFHAHFHAHAHTRSHAQAIIGGIYTILLAASIARSVRDYRLARELHGRLRAEATRPPPAAVPGVYQPPRRFPAVAMYEWSKLPFAVKAAFFSPWAIVTW